MTAGQILRHNGQSVLGSVSAAYVQALLDTAAARGVERGRLAAEAGIEMRHLDDPAWRLDLNGLLRLFDLARHAGGDDLIGLHMGMQVRPRTFSALGYAAMSCNTLGEAVALIPRYESLVYDGGSTVVSTSGGRVRLAWRSGMPDGERMRPVNEAIVAGWLSFGRWITGIRGEIREACFQHRRPAGGNEYERLFGCPVRFNAEDNALSFDIALLATPLVQHDAQLRLLMEQRAREQLQQIHGAQLTPRVVVAIRQRLPQRAPTASEIAQALDLSERSLRRRLQAERVSFGDLLVQVRRELALHYLAQPDLGLSEITLLLGYGEQSSFTAAFKSWLGLPPGEYRQRHFASPAHGG
ncbi:AraC family transcriptional regulator [Solimonas flava]|uniref:AraC family transcriptional regulator n=1 Tax=Solimonas flava TaxID=415849 RepID=UPI00042346B7|nr:AraC family transcriptional regulator [Solimonas flava]